MKVLHKLQRKLFRPQAVEGYENEELVHGTIFRKTVAYEPTGDWPLVTGVKSVLDFGGNAGLHYKILSPSNHLTSAGPVVRNTGHGQSPANWQTTG